MKSRTLVTFLILCAMILCTSCEKDDSFFVEIEGISFENYPRIDGSTSTDPLNHIIAAKLFGLKYEWENGGIVNLRNCPQSLTDKLQCSQTHGAITNLIDNQTDLIIVARTMSADEKQYADNAGVSLIETPIALDALDFIVNSQNRINSLSIEQIQNIYLGNTTNWNEVGGANEEIIPFIRNENSGSQEMMNELVMNNVGTPDGKIPYAYFDEILGTMVRVYTELTQNKNGICFTPHYYKEYMVYGKENIKTLAINGIAPNKKSIKNKTYPFVANVYVSIRSDLDRNSMAYKLYEWLQTESGKRVIEESGYVPN